MSLNRSEANQIIDGAMEEPQFFSVSVNIAVSDGQYGTLI
jgi:hypothetical protein